MYILISGVSGSGKNTIINELLKRNENLKFFKSCTTRKPRPSDEQGKFCPYHYLTEEEFVKKIKNGEMFEFQVVHGNYMGTLKESLEEVASSDSDYIKDIDVLGKESIVKAYRDRMKIITIFLSVPKEELVKRLKRRGESDENIDLRLSRYELEEEHSKTYDYIIKNISLDATIKRIEQIIKENK